MDRATCCSICNKTYSSRGNMLAHLKTHDPKRTRVRCPQCDKTFLKTSHLNRHVQQVHDRQGSAKPFSCSYCDQAFWETSVRDAHTRTHTGERPFPCAECPLRFAAKGNLNSHVKTAHTTTEPVHTCPEPGCGRRFKALRNIKAHLPMHSKNGPLYPCPTCGKSCTWKGNLNHHTRLSHELREGEHACTFCDKKFKLCKELAQHMRRHTGEKPFKCNKCGSSFSGKEGYEKHLRLVHDTKTVVCTWVGCGKIVKNSETLKLHLKTHLKTKSEFGCPREGCSRTFTMRAGVYQHIRNFHSDEKPHGCSYCSKKFVTANKLSRHIMTHTGEKPFACSSCPRKFKTTESCHDHVVRFHLDERRHACPQCAKRFYTTSEVTKHLNTHKDAAEREKLPCPQCGKQFGRKGALRAHMTTYHTPKDEWKHGCPYCDQTFPSNSYLARHVLTHTTEKPYACHSCPRRFLSCSELRGHETRFHETTDS